MAESILKAKALLIYVRENNLSATEFIKYCGDAKFDMNVLNIIKSL